MQTQLESLYRQTTVTDYLSSLKDYVAFIGHTTVMIIDLFGESPRVEIT